MLHPAASDIEQYLSDDEVIDWRNPVIMATAQRIIAGMIGDLDRAKALFEWVRDNVTHTRDAGREVVTYTASEVLVIGTGLCYAKAHLLAALLRSVGVPAGFCYQVYEEPERAGCDKLALHGLNGIYLKSLGKWIRVDPRGNNSEIDAQFSVEREQLAFPDFHFLDNLIYVRPLPNVVAALRAYSILTDLWPNLPGPTNVGSSSGSA